MINKSVFTQEHINELRERYKIDPQITERAVFALGLLEAMVKSGLDFVFKGGSSMMLLLDKPLRLSTDIDIIVKPSTDILAYVLKASQIYPFVRYEENTRVGVNQIVKKHYRFYYKSLRNENKETTILLDVLFEDNHYPSTIKKEIKTEFLKTSGEPIYVTIPSVDSLLGDKLTAFAPNTIGIKPYFTKEDGRIIDKRIEAIKQFFDVASLYDIFCDFNMVLKSYKETAQAELRYRGLEISYKDCLTDTFNSALSILSKGKINPDNYPLYLVGIRGLNNYLINVRFNAETAYIQAAKVMYLSSCLLNEIEPKEKFNEAKLLIEPYSKLNNIRKYDINYFNMVAEAIQNYEEFCDKNNR